MLGAREVRVSERQAIASLAGQVALVTGASRGIGKAVALELARAGADVVVAARTLEQKSWLPGTLRETAEAVEALGRRSAPLQVDLSRTEDVERLAGEALAAFGRVDLLVNNAAFFGRAAYHSLEELTLKSWTLQFAVNVHAPFLLCKALAPGMVERGAGRIVNVTSGAGQPVESPVPGFAYGSTKGALNVFTVGLNRDLRPSGVHALLLDPGYTRTEIAEHAEGSSNTDISEAHPVEVPARATAWLAGCPEPQRYGGRIVVAADLVAELGLV